MTLNPTLHPIKALRAYAPTGLKFSSSGSHAPAPTLARARVLAPAPAPAPAPALAPALADATFNADAPSAKLAINISAFNGNKTNFGKK